jgi:hypothetical protein
LIKRLSIRISVLNFEEKIPETVDKIKELKGPMLKDNNRTKGSSTKAAVTEIKTLFILVLIFTKNPFLGYKEIKFLRYKDKIIVKK